MAPVLSIHWSLSVLLFLSLWAAPDTLVPLLPELPSCPGLCPPPSFLLISLTLSAVTSSGLRSPLCSSDSPFTVVLSSVSACDATSYADSATLRSASWASALSPSYLGAIKGTSQTSVAK